ncbi:preprotein translocase subunit SecE [Planctomycetota bacterium]
MVSAFFQELFHVGLYKRTQGRITRQVTFSAVAVVVMAGLWRLHATLGTGLVNWPGNWMDYWNLTRNETLEATLRHGMHHGLPFALLLFGLWAAYRLVNVPGFADFLIAVEAEMNKVSWPTRGELYRSSIVVLVTIFALAAILFVFDFFWQTFFTWLQIL